MSGWRVTYDHGITFVEGPKAEARRRIEACGGGAVWVARRKAWATSPVVAGRVLDQLAARRIHVVVEDMGQAELDLTETEPANRHVRQALW